MLPVIMLTASEGPEKTKAIEAGADDFIAKPFDHDELFARVRSLLRIKHYHDTIKELNRTLEQRVRGAGRASSSGCGACSGSSRRSSPRRSSPRATSRSCPATAGRSPCSSPICVAGQASPTRSSPKSSCACSASSTRRSARLVQRFDATVGFLQGDGVQLFFNDPIEIPDAALRAVRLGCALREEMAELTPRWRKRGHELDFGAGIALGYATCGEVGFEGRSDYAAIGAVTNLASRLADEATGGQILIAQRLYAEVEDDVEVEPSAS